MTLPFCPVEMCLCAHYGGYECHRRWARPMPAEAGTTACPGFLRSPLKAKVLHVAALISGRRTLSYEESLQEVSMAGRLVDLQLAEVA